MADTVTAQPVGLLTLTAFLPIDRHHLKHSDLFDTRSKGCKIMSIPFVGMDF